MYLIPTTNAYHLAQQFENDCDVVYMQPNKDNNRLFPDGELFIHVPAGLDYSQRVVVLHAGSPNPNRSLVELLLLLSVLKKNFQNIEVCFTYFAYSQQDKASDEGECVAAKDIMDILVEYMNVKKIYLADVHFFAKDWLNDYPIVHIPVFTLLQKEVNEKYKDVIYISPDQGGFKRTGIRGFEKIRHDTYTTSLNNNENSDFKDKVVVVVDDLIETGGTLTMVAGQLRDGGAKKIIAAVSHVVLLKGYERILKIYDEVYTSNSIPHNFESVSIASRIKEFIF